MTERKDNSKWVIGILLLLIFTCSVLLYLHLTQGAKGGENPEIGILTFKHKTIERKYDSDVIWNRIESGLVIRNKDTIRSGDFSDAVLTLKDNTQININENSMIYLDVSDDNVNLNFAYGSLSLAQGKNGNSNLAKSIKINSGKTVLELKNTNIAIEKKGKEEINFHVKDKVYDAVEKVAQERKLDIILDKAANSGILYSNAAFDRTDDVVIKLGIQK